MMLKPSSNTLTFLVTSLLCVFFALGLVFGNLTSKTYSALALIGLVLLLTQPFHTLRAELSPALRRWAWIAAGLWFAVTLAWAFNGFSLEQAKTLSSPYGKLILLPLVLYALACIFKQYKPLYDTLFFLISTGAIIAGLLGLDSHLQIFSLVPAATRVGLGVNPIYYGDSALVMGFISAIFAISWAHQKRYALSFIGLAAFILGLIASGLSLSRGGWLALPIFSILALWYLISLRFYRTLIIGLTLFAGLFIWIASDADNPIHQRITKATQEVATFDLHTSRNSAGYRLRMWHHALQLSQQKPLFGHGPMSYVFHDYNEQGNLIDYYHHAHNGYLQMLSTTGIVGLLAYLLLFFMPLHYFWQHFRNNTAKDMAMAGMVVISAYLFFVLTDVIFYRSVGLLYFLLITSLLILLIERSKYALKGDEPT